MKITAFFQQDAGTARDLRCLLCPFDRYAHRTVIYRSNGDVHVQCPKDPPATFPSTPIDLNHVCVLQQRHHTVIKSHLTAGKAAVTALIVLDCEERKDSLLYSALDGLHAQMGHDCAEHDRR